MRHFRCVACKCQECEQSPKGTEVFNPPLTFVIDTTKSVKPDKDSIFNLTQKGNNSKNPNINTSSNNLITITTKNNQLKFIISVVNKIVESNVNIPNYQLITFNDYGPDINRNVKVFPPTQDVIRFR